MFDLLETVGPFLLHVLFGAPMLLVLVPGWSVARGKILPEPAQDLARRRMAWAALSELYLDTSLDECELAGLCETLRSTGYTVHELEQILLREVHPQLFVNLLSVAGEWVGFDLARLEQRILASWKRRPLLWPVPAKWLVWSEWRQLERQLMAAQTIQARA